MKKHLFSLRKSLLSEKKAKKEIKNIKNYFIIFLYILFNLIKKFIKYNYLKTKKLILII